MYLAARRLGIADRWFWAATPKELAWEVEARQERQQGEKAKLWLLAALIRSKKLPDFKQFIGYKARPQTWQEMRARVHAAAGHDEPADRRSRRPDRSQRRP